MHCHLRNKKTQCAGKYYGPTIIYNPLWWNERVLIVINPVWWKCYF